MWKCILLVQYNLLVILENLNLNYLKIICIESKQCFYIYLFLV